MYEPTMRSEVEAEMEMEMEIVKRSALILVPTIQKTGSLTRNAPS